jgi:methyltransferase family protein
VRLNPLWATIDVSLKAMIDLLTVSEWQMTFGERAALEGLLAELKPKLAIEIGTAEGGSVRRIAIHSDEVHSFDLVEPSPATRALANVTFHTGDSHALLPQYLEQVAVAGGRIDFVLVDGDHSADGVRRDLDDLLASDAIAGCMIVIHDTANKVVRAGLEMVDYDAYPKVKHVDLDFIAGHLSIGGPFHHQLWGGLGLVVVDDGAQVQAFGGPQEGEFYSTFELLDSVRDRLREQEPSAQPTSPREAAAGSPPHDELVLREDLERAQAALTAIQRSPSWRLTAPLRALKHAVRGR